MDGLLWFIQVTKIGWYSSWSCCWWRQCWASAWGRFGVKPEKALPTRRIWRNVDPEHVQFQECAEQMPSLKLTWHLKIAKTLVSGRVTSVFWSTGHHRKPKLFRNLKGGRTSARSWRDRTCAERLLAYLGGRWMMMMMMMMMMMRRWWWWWWWWCSRESFKWMSIHLYIYIWPYTVYIYIHNLYLEGWWSSLYMKNNVKLDPDTKWIWGMSRIVVALPIVSSLLVSCRFDKSANLFSVSWWKHPAGCS